MKPPNTHRRRIPYALTGHEQAPDGAASAGIGRAAATRFHADA